MEYLPKKGIETELIEFSSNGRVVQGALFTPDRKLFGQSNVAAVLVHGVESYWYSGPTMFLACGLAEAGYTTLAYNGVHSGESFRTSEFETAAREVGDAVGFAGDRGFREIFLAGHSLGTPIVEYYQGDHPDPAVKALGLCGPHIDIPAVTRDSLLGPELYAKFAAECRELAARGSGEEIRLLPFREGKFIVTSAKTFLSYRDVETSKAAVEKMVRNIKVPIAIVYDQADNIIGKGTVTTRDSIARRIQENGTASPRVDRIVIPSRPGNSPFQAHLFIGNERVVTEETVKWLRSVGLPPAARR